MTDLPTELRDAAGDGSFTHTAFTPATLLVRAADALDDAAEIDDIATAMVEWSTAQARRIDKLCAETEQQRAEGRALTVFATALELLPNVLRPLFDRRKLRSTLLELDEGFAERTPNTDLVIGLAMGRVIGYEVERGGVQ